MIHNTIEIVQKRNESTIIISSRRSKVYAIFLIAIFGMCALALVMVLINLISSLISGNFTMILMIGLAIFLLCTALLGRLTLWNIYGKEVLRFSEDTLEVLYDYKLFKNKLDSISGTRWVANANGPNLPRSKHGVLDDELLSLPRSEMVIHVKSDRGSHLTTLKTNQKDTRQICAVIENINVPKEKNGS